MSSSYAMPRPATFRVWTLAVRPKTLPAAAAPVLVGSGCAVVHGRFSLEGGMLALAGALLLQIAANFANDAFDYERGADTAERLGPQRAVQAGWVSSRQMKWALAVAVALALGVGVRLAFLAGWPLVLIGIACIVGAVAYTAGPWPLAYLGLGEAAVLVFFGQVAVVGTYFVHTGTTATLPFLCALSVGCLASNILVVNNVRDIDTDRKAGKWTLAARWGRRFGEREYALFGGIAYAVLPLLALLQLAPLSVLLPLLSFPLFQRELAQLRRRSGPTLNATLAATAGLLLLFSLLLATGLALGRYLT